MPFKSVSGALWFAGAVALSLAVLNVVDKATKGKLSELGAR